MVGEELRLRPHPVEVFQRLLGVVVVEVHSQPAVRFASIRWYFGRRSASSNRD